MDTCVAACVQDYPVSLFRVIVLDDSRSSEVADAINRLRKEKFSHLFYASRDDRKEGHDKPANLNFGLKYAETLDAPTPAYVAVLDVDMIPEPHWLKTTTTPLLRDKGVGLVCPPQRFYNIPPGDPLGICHDWTRIELLIKMQNFASEGWCTGTGFVVRREALDQIGGFPVGHLQDDITTSLFLSCAGWRTLCIHDSLQWGLVPDSFAGWVKQRQRWTMGMLGVTNFVYSRRARDLPVMVRIKSALWGIVDAYEAVAFTVALVMFLILVTTLRPLLPPNHLSMLLYLATADFLLHGVSDYLVSSILSFRVSLLGRLSVIWLAPYKLSIILKVFILPPILGKPLPKFSPGGIPETGESERTAREQSGSCLITILQDCNA